MIIGIFIIFLILVLIWYFVIKLYSNYQLNKLRRNYNAEENKSRPTTRFSKQSGKSESITAEQQKGSECIDSEPELSTRKRDGSKRNRKTISAKSEPIRIDESERRELFPNETIERNFKFVEHNNNIKQSSIREPKEDWPSFD